MDNKGPSDSDRSLLDRLNALRASTVTLDPPSNSLGPPAASPLSVVAPEGPTQSVGDALSARLRALRNRSDGEQSASGDKSPPSLAATAGTQPSCTATPRDGTRLETGATSPSTKATHDEVEKVDDDDDGNDDLLNDLYLPDEDAMDEFLEFLKRDDEEAWGRGGGGGGGGNAAQLRSIDPEEESRRVADLLESIKSGKLVPPPADIIAGDADDAKRPDSDNSDGEEMSRQVEDILSKALDEASSEREKKEEPGDPEGQERTSSSSQHADERNDVLVPDKKGAAPKKQQDVEDGNKSDLEASDPFSLPSVPSALVDPIPSQRGEGKGEGEGEGAKTRKSLDFESDISSRLAALKGLGTAPATDEWGLPSAPTFRPEDRSLAKKSSGGGAGVGGVKKRVGYTDEDVETWCIVCLEDATVRCVDCDDDVYCESCWRAMHVGPSAGYDERGHKRVKFVRR